MSAGRIAVVLPAREHFTRTRSGAVALCARDFARFSRFASRIDIFGADACDYDDVSYRQLEGWRRWWRRDRHAYADAVARGVRGYALIEAQNRPQTMPVLRRAAPDAKLVLHLHNDPQSMAGSRSLAERARLLDLCDAIYCVSDWVRGRLLQGLEDRRGRALVMLNGVNVPEATPKKERIVAFTGLMNAIKGATELVRAFAAADVPGWRLVMAGADRDGVLASLARERAALDKRFDYLGQIGHADAMELLARAEIAVVPSVWEEPCGRAAIEALAQGCAVVTSRRGGLPEVAGDDALYVDPGDAAAFARDLRELMGDETRRRDLQTRAKARAQAVLEIGAATARLDAARARLLGEP